MIAVNILALYAQPQGTFKLSFLLEDLVGDDLSAQNALLGDLHYGNESLMVLQDGDDQRLVEILNVSQDFGVQTNYFHNITLTLRERDVVTLLGLTFRTVINKHVGYSVSLPEFAEDGTTAITGHLLEYKLQTETAWTRGAVQSTGNGAQDAVIELPTENLYDIRVVARSASGDEQVSLQRMCWRSTPLCAGLPLRPQRIDLRYLGQTRRMRGTSIAVSISTDFVCSKHTVLRLR